MKKIIKQCLSTSLSVLLITNCVPLNCFAQDINSFFKVDTPVNHITEQTIFKELRLKEITALSNRMPSFKTDYSVGDIESLKSILEDYREFLKNWNMGNKAVTQESLVEELAKKYVKELPDYTEFAIAKNSHLYAIERDIKELDKLLKSGHKTTRRYLMLSTSEIIEIQDIQRCNGWRIFFTKEYIEGISDTFIKNLEPDFLRNIFNQTREIMRKNNPELEQRLLQRLLISEKDTPQVIIGKLQKFLQNSVNYIPRASKDSIINMIKVLNKLPKQELDKFLAEVDKKLSPTQKILIEDMKTYFSDSGTLRFYDSLLKDAANSIPQEATARAAAGKAASVAAKVVTPAVLILGSLWILNNIVNVDGGSNTFAQSVSPAEIKHKIKNGTATRDEQIAYYMMPCSVEYIEENPVQFASVLFTAAELASNPAYKKLMDDPIFKIEGWNPSKTEVSEKLEQEINKAMDNVSVDLEFSKA